MISSCFHACVFCCIFGVQMGTTMTCKKEEISCKKGQELDCTTMEVQFLCPESKSWLFYSSFFKVSLNRLTTHLHILETILLHTHLRYRHHQKLMREAKKVSSVFTLYVWLVFVFECGHST